jgi:predicted ATP-dependent endonuclease of OLD family
MYLSRIYIENFRSIQKLDLSFIKGKNIIIGRNNAGKSNIIKAIDLLLGESSPDYFKSENITDSDFFTAEGKN